jgi:hypothetical protein
VHLIQDVRRATKVLNDPSPSRLRRELAEPRDRPQPGGSVVRKSALSPHAPATQRTLLNLRFHHGLLLRHDRRAVRSEISVTGESSAPLEMLKFSMHRGGMIMGIGMALTEETLLDERK